jgi:hypothetical protein
VIKESSDHYPRRQQRTKGKSMLPPNDPVHKICELISERDTLKLSADIDELTERYKPMVRDVLIVITNPDSPEQLVNVMSDELQFQTKDLLDRVNAKKLESIERFLPLLLAFNDLDLLVETNH